MKRESQAKNGLSRRTFGARIATLGLLAPLVGWHGSAAVAVSEASTPSLNLPPGGSDFWQRPYDFVGCLHDDGLITMCDDPDLVSPGTVGSGSVVGGGKVLLGLGFVEVQHGEEVYLLRVLDRRTSQAAIAMGQLGQSGPNLRISRGQGGSNLLAISVKESSAASAYLLESCDSLDRPAWKPVAETLGTGGGVEFQVPAGTGPQGFFRLRAQPRLGL